MLEKTEGIVFRTVRYGDSSLIVKLFTKKFGYLSFMVPGVRSGRNKQKGNILQPMQLLQLDLYWREQKNLLKLKEYAPACIYASLQTDFVKQSVGIFAVEVASKCVKEHEQNEPLYDFLKDFLLMLDGSAESPENQPLFFLWRVSGILGFEPSADAGEGDYFNVSAGQFEALPSATEQPLSRSDSALFKKFLEAGEGTFSGRERRILLDAWLLYFQWHVPDFGALRSPKILHEVLK